VASEGKVVVKVMPVPAHFGPFCVGVGGTVGIAVMVAAAVEYAL
jgi:hypothetical protein